MLSKTQKQAYLLPFIYLSIGVCPFLNAASTAQCDAPYPLSYTDEQRYSRLIQVENWQKTQEIVCLKNELRNLQEQLHEVRLNLLKKAMTKAPSVETTQSDHDLLHEQLWAIITNLEEELELSRQKIAQFQSLSPSALQKEIQQAHEESHKLKLIVQKLEESEQVLRNELQEQTAEIAFLEQKLLQQVSANIQCASLPPEEITHLQQDIDSLKLQRQALEDELDCRLAEIQKLQAELNQQNPQTTTTIDPLLEQEKALSEDLRQELMAIKSTYALEKTQLQDQLKQKTLELADLKIALEKAKKQQLDKTPLDTTPPPAQESSIQSEKRKLQQTIDQQSLHIEELNTELERQRAKSRELEEDIEALLTN
jgi:hypothetical protein